MWKSDKRDTDQIGENGIGVKQAILRLSDTGLIITRDGDDLSCALISNRLQLENKR